MQGITATFFIHPPHRNVGPEEKTTIEPTVKQGRKPEKTKNYRRIRRDNRHPARFAEKGSWPDASNHVTPQVCRFIFVAALEWKYERERQAALRKYGGQ
jgi:hypothetical protein